MNILLFVKICFQKICFIFLKTIFLTKGIAIGALLSTGSNGDKLQVPNAILQGLATGNERESVLIFGQTIFHFLIFRNFAICHFLRNSFEGKKWLDSILFSIFWIPYDVRSSVHW